MSAPDALVYVDLDRRPVFAGRMWAHTYRGQQTASFVYDQGWIERELFALDPALRVGPGTHYTRRSLFGAIGDSAPDRWGRTLLQRRERLLADKENRARRQLRQIDFLLGHADLTRQGALRFRTEPEGPFLAKETGVPPLVRLGDLLGAADRVLTDRETEEDLRLLLEPGASLQGSRPKASVLGRDGELMIAKFNRPDDSYDVGLWEAVAMQLAGLAGIRTAEWSLERVGDRTVFITKRFDRDSDRRIPFLSALSMLEAEDGEHRSYTEIADGIRQTSASTTEDLRELWRRMVFTVLISNIDDHLRNHGFLYAGSQGWRLSPAYDVNPMSPDEGQRILATALVEGDDRSASIDLAFEAASHFNIGDNDANQIAHEVAAVVRGWREVASNFGASAGDCDEMASAFEHDDIRVLG